MAAKKPVAKKSVAKTSDATKKTASKKRSVNIKKLYAERNPDKHQVTGKYKFFYIFFACTTLFFMAMTVWLFVYASEVQNKYESIEACARAHTRCHVTQTDEGLNAESESGE